MLEEVTQRVEGWPFGECVRAAYAYLFDWPIDEVPRFDPAVLEPGEEQHDRECAWLASLGINLISLNSPDERPLSPQLLAQVPPVIHLMSGLSSRGLGHRCIGYRGHVFFDPHPSRDGLVLVYSLGFLEPLR